MSPLPHPVGFFAAAAGAAWANDYSGWFDAGDDMLQGSTTLLNFDSTDAWSVSLWARTDTTSQHTYLLSKMDTGGVNAGWGVGLYQNKLLMTFIHDLGGGWQLERGGNSPYISTGAWHHFVYTYDGSEAIAGMKMYVDGTECPAYTNFATSIQSPATSTGSLLVAAEIVAKGTVFYGGYLDEVAVFNTELSAANVTTLFNLQSYVQGQAYDISAFAGIQSYWQMGDQPGDSFANLGTIFDAAGSNDLTCHNTVVGNKVTDNASKFTNHTSTDFDGVDDYAIAQNPPIFNYNSTFSVSAWFKTLSGNQTVILSKQVNWANFEGWSLYMTAAGEMKLGMMNSGADQLDVYTNGSSFNDGDWHHVLCCVDGSATAAGVTMYVDGSPVALTAARDTLTSSILNAENLQVGARGSFLADLYFEGQLDEISIYTTELSAGDATALFNGGTPVDISTLASWANIHTWWRMGDGASDTADTLGTMSAGGTTTDHLECANMVDTAIMVDTPP